MHPVTLNGLTALDIVKQPLNKWKDNAYHVKSTSLHDIRYTGEMRLWETFKSEVRDNLEELKLEKYETVLSYGQPDKCSPNNIIFFEHFMCGEELSTSGRWVQTALQPMGGVGSELGFTSEFGDWKSTSASAKDFGDPEAKVPVDTVVLPNPEEVPQRKRKAIVPDYALMSKLDREPLIVGEGKTPWKHDFEGWWHRYMENQSDDSSEAVGHFSQVVGQIMNYMYTAELKYGFLTNHKSTFFLKREKIEEVPVLFFSEPIAFNKPSCFGKSPDVSVRECLLYFQKLVEGGPEKFKFEKTLPYPIVHKGKANQDVFRGGARDSKREISSHYYPQENKSENDTKGKQPERPSASESNRPQTRSVGRQGGEVDQLTTNMAGMNVRDESVVQGGRRVRFSRDEPEDSRSQGPTPPSTRSSGRGQKDERKSSGKKK